MYKLIEHSTLGYGDKVVKRFKKLNRAVAFARKLNSNTCRGARNFRYEVWDESSRVWDDIEGFHDSHKILHDRELFLAVHGSDGTI